MTDLVRREDLAPVVNPVTGEIVPMDAPTDQLAEFLSDVREFERAMRDQKQHVSQELHRRMDADAIWTVHLGDWTVSGESPARVEYDAELLHRKLTEFVEAHVIPQRALEDAVITETKYRARVSGINRLAKLGGDLAKAIESCQIPLTRERRITVKRAGQ